MSRRGGREPYKKIYAWNPLIAYVAGLIASDGCLSNDGRHLNLTSNDLEILNIVIQILDLKVKIGQKRNGYGGFGTQIQFGDVALYDFLLKAGITPAKSKTILRVDVPDIYYGDFLRGLFDGDGTVYGYWDPRWRSSLMYYVGFISASSNFLYWISAANERLAGTSSGKISQVSRASVLRYAKSDSQKLFNLMYKNFNSPCLNRKRTKFVDFLKLDPYPDKALVARVAEW
ncbi:MAG TPA: LAGLIDADG family homing endonuclease [Candidatus Saccharimonadales bacterium]|nr:LAGLIDADG family homing endonuclease [Candidatus Saccharimonadales bacterium]